MASQFRALHAAGVARACQSVLALGAVLFLAGGAGGCGKAGLNASGADGADAGAAALLKGVFKAYCAAARSCCAKAGLSTELSDCETQAPTQAYLTSLVDRGEMAIDATAIPACEAAYRQTATTCTINQIATECRKVFVGLQGENEPCSTARSCQSAGEPTICLSVGSVGDSRSPGSCRKKVHGKAGDRCLSTCWGTEECLSDFNGTSADEATVTYCFETDGLFCSGDPGTCVRLPTIGESCIIDSPLCGALAYCDSNSICRPGATLGQPCTSGSGCAYPLRCGPDKTCVSGGGESRFADAVSCKGFPYWL